jgi:electron transfer flavoprotein alpha subunit
MKILVLGECERTSLSPLTHRAVTAARTIGDNISVLVFGNNCREAAQQAAMIEGVETVLVADRPAYSNHLALPVIALVEHVGGRFSHIIGVNSGMSKDVIPGVAARLGVCMVSDVIGIYGPDRFLRPVYSGQLNVEVQVDVSCKLLTIRAGSFDPAGERRQPAPLHETDFVADCKTVELLEEKGHQSGTDMQTASTLIGGGRGIGSRENFVLLNRLADRLRGAVGASMGAVEVDLASHERLIGQTGKTVAPDLYIAAGISGSPYHLAGIRDSKIIVAINKDPDAPIFEAADYGFVGDLTQLLPKLIEKL